MMETQTETKKLKVVIFGHDQFDALPILKHFQSEFGKDVEISTVPGEPGDLGVLFHELVISKPDILAVRQLENLGDLVDMIHVERNLKWNNPAGKVLSLEVTPANEIFHEILRQVKSGNALLGL